MFLEEFINKCVKCGYISGWNCRERVREWCSKHPKSVYTSDDFIEVYRYFNTLDIGTERRPAKENVVYLNLARGNGKGSNWSTICEYLAAGKAVAVKVEDGYHWFYPEDYNLD